MSEIRYGMGEVTEKILRKFKDEGYKIYVIGNKGENKKWQKNQK